MNLRRTREIEMNLRTDLRGEWKELNDFEGKIN